MQGTGREPVDVLVIGLGYVGLPLVREAVGAGYRVAGFDRSAAVVASLRAGRSHVDDVTDDDVRALAAGGFRAVSDEAELPPPRTVVICVPTPLSRTGGPDLAALRAAARTAGGVLGPDSLVIVESTSFPGTTDEVVRPILEERSGLRAGTDFHLAFSPERIDPGNKRFGLRNTPKVVGGHTPACATAAVAFYAKLCDEVVQAKSTREAEMAKLLENTYRYVNIALVNEMAMFCRELGVDLWDAIRCAGTKPFGFQAFRPGPGVGGHCIPVDPHYLSYRTRAAGVPFRFVELAEDVNRRMARHVVDRAAELLARHGGTLAGAEVLLLGVTYKEDVADQRETPALPVARELLARSARLAYHDPYVADWRVDGAPVRRATDLAAGLAGADLAILLQAHRAYGGAEVARTGRPLLDTRGGVAAPRAEAL
ncbi:nucleotide sugar dehydrogenase [Actinomadura atramentaria]|uniref:nucleotide sugar dehydrogenase n=1 Tax=Actinomadura atramentaria TaxID=1990 RepID=UPI0005256E10|nr:nucleotide sugar dehydrogenase [Actinomadura atramentaria]